MSIVIDCHVHLYPAYDEGALFDAALNNLNALTPTAHKAILLVERSDCDRFATLQAGSSVPSGFELSTVDAISLKLTSKTSGDSLLVIAGRQIATCERLEVLSWCSQSRIPDGLALNETIATVRQVGGVPALAWAPGKWFGARGALIQAAIADQTCRPLMLCDTTLRPVGWPTPPQFLEAMRQGIPVMAGTDPLPMAGEEQEVGRFGVLFESAETLDTGEKLRAFLANPPSQQVLRGVRNGPGRWLYRYGSFMLCSR